MQRTLLLLAVSILLVTGAASQSHRPAPEIRGTLGWASFPDESSLNHFVAGGSVRYYITPRIAFEPELHYMKGPGFDHDVVFIPHVVFQAHGTKTVKPYVFGGIGVLFHRDTFFPQPGRSENFWGKGQTWGGGMGVKIYITERLFVAPELRMGWEPFIRLTGSLGYSF